MPPAATLLQLLLIGLTNGAVIALNAIAVSLIYGVVRTLNLAHGDVFALTTVAVTSLVAALGLSLDSPPLTLLGGLALTVGLAVVVGGGLSVFVERAAFQPFRSASGAGSRLAPLSATLGLAFIFYQAALIWRYFLPNWIPGEHRSVPGIPELPRDRIPEILPTLNLLPGSGVTLLAKDVWVLATALACAAGVWVFLNRTRTGRAIRAVSQNVELARVVGVNPDAVIRQTFLLGGLLVGVAAFVFAAYYTRPFAVAGAQSGLIAFAAAILGGIGNPLGALASGLLLGVFAACSDFFLQAQWTPVLLQALLITLLVLRRTGFTEDEAPASERDRLAVSSAGRRRGAESLGLWLLVAVALAYPLLDSALGWSRQSTATSLAIFALLALGLNVLLGWAGLLDLGYAVSFGLGGYAAALLLTETLTGVRGLDFTVVLAASALVAGAFGALKGALTSRLRSDDLAIVTLAVGQLARLTLTNLSGLAGPGGSIAAVPAPTLFTHVLSTPVERYYLAVGLALVAALASLRLLRSRIGRAWLALSADETAAASSGVNVARFRALAFVVAAAVAGMAGALYASTFTYIDPESVDFRLSVMTLAMVILGGAGSVPGALLGAVLIAGYDQIGIPLLGQFLAQFQTGDLRFGSAFDARGLSYLNFGLALYLTVWLRARRRK